MEMHWEYLKFKHLCILICVTFIITCFISTMPLNVNNCDCKTEYVRNQLMKSSRKYSAHRLAILVPFRDRFDELLEFVPHMNKFLAKQNVDYHIFILNQVDKYRFNRAALINAGFLETKKKFDHIAMHDVDLLPLNDNLKYAYPGDGPLHISSPEFHPRYNYPTFIGGILLINRQHFIRVDGMSNRYWGWGQEDDEFYLRLREASLPIKRPLNITTGRHDTIKHIHDTKKRKRDYTKCYNQKEVTRKRDRETGLHSVLYNVEKTFNLAIDNISVTVLNIALQCNIEKTPWCNCNEQ